MLKRLYRVENNLVEISSLKLVRFLKFGFALFDVECEVENHSRSI